MTSRFKLPRLEESNSMEPKAKHHVETDFPIAKVAEAIVAERSIGTWTAVRGQDNPLAARAISAEGTEVEIGFPDELFEPGTFPNAISWWQELFGLAIFMIASLCDCFILSAPWAFSEAHQPA